MFRGFLFQIPHFPCYHCEQMVVIFLAKLDFKLVEFDRYEPCKFVGLLDEFESETDVERL